MIVYVVCECGLFLDLPDELSSSHLQHRGGELLLQQLVGLLEMWRVGFIDSNKALKAAYSDLIWAARWKDRMKQGSIFMDVNS